jgi:hypothetical protein
MGTNYYWEPKPPCECCGRPFERVHIGKSSCGWAFALHVADPKCEWDDTPKSLEDWQNKWVVGRILDEYGTQHAPEDMLSEILDRSHPCGLMHHADGHCIGHGDGTYDLIVGEFS